MKDVPKFNELMWPTLEAIKQLGGSDSTAEIMEKLCRDWQDSRRHSESHV